MAEYTITEPTTLKLNVTNLTDELYADSLYRGFYVPGAARTVQLGSQSLAENEMITLDGNDGAIYAGQATSALVPDTALRERLTELRGRHPGKKPRSHGG
jgi:hypothetical protein